jgi:hypothetical protein
MANDLMALTGAGDGPRNATSRLHDLLRLVATSAGENRAPARTGAPRIGAPALKAMRSDGRLRCRSEAEAFTAPPASRFVNRTALA